MPSIGPVDGFSKPHPDDEWVDEVRIKLVERWKSSGLSGDEWRFSAVLQFLRKGRLLHERSFRDIETALAGAPWAWLTWGETEQDMSKVDRGTTEHLCFQPGCTNPAGPKMFLLKEYTEHGDGPLPSSSFPRWRRFCEKHMHRGDCGLEDADTNYTTVPPSAKIETVPDPTTRPHLGENVVLTESLDNSDVAKLNKADMLPGTFAAQPKRTLGHKYRGAEAAEASGRLADFYTSYCEYECGCWMGGCSSGGPKGIDPFGDCPQHPDQPMNQPKKEKP